MIPIPPTRSDTLAIAASSERHHLRGLFGRLGNVRLIAHREIIVLPVGEAVRLAHDRGDVLLCCGDIVG